MTSVWLLFLLILFSSHLHTDAITLTITPKMAQRKQFEKIDITCNSNSSLKDCQFNVWVEEDDGKWESTLNTTTTALSAMYRNYKDSPGYKRFDYTLYKERLSRGRCELSMSNLTSGRYLVGCRGRNDSSGWSYAHMALSVLSFVSTKEYRSDMTADFKEVQVELNNKSPDIEFNKTEIFSGCDFYFPDSVNHVAQSVKLSQSNKTSITKTKSARLKSYGCIASLKVSRSSNGILWCLFNLTPAKATTEYTEFGLAIIQSTENPKPPVLTTSKATYTAGQTLRARCTVEDARPVARIVWTLGGDVVRNDSDDDDVDRAWSWPWEVKSITQELTRNLTEEDDGKNLTCQVYHPNAIELRWSESFLIEIFKISSPETTGNMSYNITESSSTESTDSNDAESKTVSVVIPVIVFLLLSVGAVILVIWLRRKRDVALLEFETIPAKNAVAPNRVTILEENDLYQSSPSLQGDNLAIEGVRESTFSENVYEELDVPEASPCDTVHYEEVDVAPPSTDAIPVANGVTYSKVTVR